MRHLAVLFLGFLLAAPPAGAQTVATEGGSPRALTASARPPLREWSARVWTLGLRTDLGEAYGYGVGVLSTVESGFSRGGLGGSSWVSLGGDLRVLTLDHTRVDGVLASAVGRVSALGCGGGGALEAALGLASGLHDAPNTTPMVFPVAHLGVSLGVHWLQVGYSYQFPIGAGRPAWLSSHQLSVRVELPFQRTETRVTERPLP
jgi:hypothetical protein